MAQIVKRKNKNGSASYLFRVSTGYDRNGKQVTTSRTFTPPPTLTGRKLEKEVRRRADEFEREVHNGLALDADMKLDDLIDRWFSEYIDKKCKPKTGVEYRYLRPRISAALGHMRVNQIRPSHLMAFIPVWKRRERGGILYIWQRLPFSKSCHAVSGRRPQRLRAWVGAQ